MKIQVTMDKSTTFFHAHTLSCRRIFEDKLAVCPVWTVSSFATYTPLAKSIPLSSPFLKEKGDREEETELRPYMD